MQVKWKLTMVVLPCVLLLLTAIGGNVAAAQEKKEQQSAKPSAPEQKAKQPERIAIPDLKKKLDSGEKFLLIDVREDWELKQDGAIEGAIHIPMGDLDARMKDIPKDVEVVFY